MDGNEIAVVTMTWARDPREEALLRESLPLLAAGGLPVFVTDGGSGGAFVDFLRALPGFNVCGAERGLWPQVRRGLRAARESGRAFVLYTEPDKRDFFRRGLREFISEADGGEGVGVVLASRSADSFSTFPEFLRGTEQAINRCCAELVGEHYDFTYGPFLMNAALAPRLEGLPDELAWGWRPYTFSAARRLGYRVESVVKDLPCPPEQREDSPAERIYRMRQLGQSIEGLMLSAGVAAASRAGAEGRSES